MARVRSGLAIGAGAAALAVGVPVNAWADPAPAAPAPMSELTVSPATAYPGGAVDLRTFADCGGGTGTVVSAAFGPSGAAALAPAADGGLFAGARVGRDVRPGSYRVVEVCGDSPVAAGMVTVRPVGAVGAGGGWGALRASGVLGSPAVAASGSVAGIAAQLLTGAAGLAAVLFGVVRRRVGGRGY